MNNPSFLFLELKIIFNCLWDEGRGRNSGGIQLFIFIFDEKHWQIQFIIFNTFNSVEKKNLMAYGRDEGEEINESWLVEHVGTTGLGSPRGFCWFFGFMNVESVWSRLECICRGSCQLSGLWLNLSAGMKSRRFLSRKVSYHLSLSHETWPPMG